MNRRRRLPRPAVGSCQLTRRGLRRHVDEPLDGSLDGVDVGGSVGRDGGLLLDEDPPPIPGLVVGEAVVGGPVERCNPPRQVAECAQRDDAADDQCPRLDLPEGSCDGEQTDDTETDRRGDRLVREVVPPQLLRVEPLVLRSRTGRDGLPSIELVPARPTGESRSLLDRPDDSTRYSPRRCSRATLCMSPIVGPV
jgi:hypothetical protein